MSTILVAVYKKTTNPTIGVNKAAGLSLAQSENPFNSSSLLGKGTFQKFRIGDQLISKKKKKSHEKQVYCDIIRQSYEQRDLENFESSKIKL